MINTIINNYKNTQTTIPMMKQDHINFLMACSHKINLNVNRVKGSESTYQLLAKYVPETNNKIDKVTKRKQYTHHQELCCISYNILQTLNKNKRSMQFCCLPHVVTGFNKATTTKLSYERLTNLLNLMEQDGLIIRFKGGKDTVTKASYVGVYWFTDKLIDLLDGVYVKNLPEDHNNIVIRTRSKGKKDTRLEFTDIKFKGKAQYDKVIKALNKGMLDNHVVMNGLRWTDQYQAVFLTESKDITKFVPSIGGRLYGGKFQTQPSGKWEEQIKAGVGRNTMSINGSKVVEVDCVAMHPTLAYTQEGITLSDSFSPYAVCFDSCGITYSNTDHKQARKLVKMALLMMINAKDKKAAKSALHLEYVSNKNTTYSNIDKVDYEKLIDAISLHNKDIKQYFCSDSGVKFQYIDSQISLNTMWHFLSKGVLCLPYHDSWVVPLEYEQELHSVIKASWSKVLKTSINCKTETDMISNPKEIQYHVHAELVDGRICKTQFKNKHQLLAQKHMEANCLPF